MMTALSEADIQNLLVEKEALLKGHFLLSSGLHSEYYLQAAKLLQYPDIASRLGESLAQKFEDIPIDLVIAPALGGVYVSHEVARALKVRSLFVERVDGTFALRRGFEIKKNERILVVEDVVTTGKSTREVLKLLESLPGQCVAVGSIIDRSSGKVDFGVPYRSLLKMQIETFKPEDCPEHLKDIPAIKPGSRAS